MPSPLTGLATELAVMIFASCDSFASVTALASTSHHFNSIWTAHVAMIGAEVLPRTVESFDTLYECEIVEQKIAGADIKTKTLAPAVALQRIKDITTKAKDAELMFSLYLDTCDRFKSNDLTPRLDKRSFHEAYYRVKMLSIFPPAPVPHSALAPITVAALCGINEYMIWFSRQIGAEEHERLGHSEKDRETFLELIELTYELGSDLYYILHENEYICPDRRIYGFLDWNLYPSSVKAMEDTKIVELLPALRKMYHGHPQWQDHFYKGIPATWQYVRYAPMVYSVHVPV